MPTESVVFAPEIDERELDRTVDDTNEAFSEAATDLPVSVDDRSIDGFEDSLQNAADDVVADIEAEMDAMTPGGGGAGGALAGGLLGSSFGGGGGAPALPSGAAAGGGAAAMASRIPKPIAGVAAAAAMPVALAGGVGAGMLSAMQNASARMQTSATIMGQAWNNVWRPIGDQVDSLFVRPVAKDLLSSSQNFEDLWRSGKPLEGIEALATGRDPRQTSKLTRIIGNAGAGLGLVGGGLAGAKAGGALGATLGSIVPGAGTAIGGTAGGIGGALVGAIAGTGIGGRIASAIGDKIPDISLPEIPEFSWPSLPDFGWPDLPEFGWPDIPDFGWPDLPEFSWPSLPSFNWPHLPSFRWPSLPSFNWPSLPTFSWPDIPTVNWDEHIPEIKWGQILNDVPVIGSTPDPDAPPEEQVEQGISPIRDALGFQSGGVVRKPTPVMAGEAGPEVIAPVAEFRRMIQGAMQQGSGSGGGGQEVDMSRVESKLDDLNRNIKALQSAFDVSVEVDSEEIARASKNGEQNRIGDTNPSV